MKDPNIKAYCSFNNSVFQDSHVPCDCVRWRNSDVVGFSLYAGLIDSPTPISFCLSKFK